MGEHTFFWKKHVGILLGIFILVVIILIVLGVEDFGVTAVYIRVLLLIAIIIFYMFFLNIYPDVLIEQDRICLQGSIVKKNICFIRGEISCIDVSRTGTGILICKVRGTYITRFLPVILFGIFLIHSSISDYDKLKESISGS